MYNLLISEAITSTRASILLLEVTKGHTLQRDCVVPFTARVNNQLAINKYKLENTAPIYLELVGRRWDDCEIYDRYEEWKRRGCF